MKKKSLLVAAIMTSMFSFAQETEVPSKSSNDVRSKRGHIILPQAGDIALGFNAVPVADALFNALRFVSIEGGNAGTPNGVIGDAIQFTEERSNVQIVGKYFITDNSAVRVRFGHNTLRGTTTTQVQDALVLAEAVNGTPFDIQDARLFTVDDEMTFRNKNVTLVVGYEKRRGYGRLQGFYGGEFGLNFTNSDVDIEYGNAFSDVHPIEHTQFGGGSSNLNSVVTSLPFTSDIADPLNERVLDYSFQGGIGFSARAFIGVEYFFAPKISVSAEYGWGYTYTNTSEQYGTYEVYRNGQNGPETLIEERDLNQSSSTHGFSVDNNSGTAPLTDRLNSTSLTGSSGAITLLFHF